MYANFKIIFLLLLAQIVNARRNNITSGIFFGREIDISEAKFVVQVIHEALPNLDYICAGSLIAPLFVLTGGNCVISAILRDITVIGGARHYLEGGLRRKVRRQYFPDGDWLDIALLRLRAPLTGPNIQPIPLCNVEWGLKSHFNVYGWGKAQIGDEFLYSQRTLKEVQMPMVSQSICSLHYAYASFNIEEYFICIELLETPDAFTGNSGGPAVINNSLCAVTTLGFRNLDSPFDLYVDIKFLKTFIEQYIKY